MATEPDREWTVAQQLANEAVGAALASSLREPILEAVDDDVGLESARTNGNEATGSASDRTTESDDTGTASVQSDEGDDASSQFVTLVQGLAVFVVMFIVLYVALRKLTDDE